MLGIEAFQDVDVFHATACVGEEPQDIASVA
jgi:hypothetical protein